MGNGGGDEAAAVLCAEELPFEMFDRVSRVRSSFGS